MINRKKGEKVEKIQITLPVKIHEEGAFFVAECPVFDIVSQGKSKKEAEKNIAEALILFLEDKDVQKQYADTISKYIVKNHDTMQDVDVQLEVGCGLQNPRAIGA